VQHLNIAVSPGWQDKWLEKNEWIIGTSLFAGKIKGNAFLIIDFPLFLDV
jgi:hypothetical protein